MSEKLFLITRELFEQATSAEMIAELEGMLSVYIQHAPVDRAQLATTTNISSKLLLFLHKAEKEVEIEDDTYK